VVAADVLLRAARFSLAARDARLARRFATAAADRGAVHDAARINADAAVLTADQPALENTVAEVWNDADLPDGHRLHLTRRLAMARFSRGDLDGALEIIDGAGQLVTEPRALTALLSQRALLLANNGRPLEALAALKEVNDGGDPIVRAELASARSIACLSIGRFGDARAAAQAGAAAHTEMPSWMARRGMAAHLVNEVHALAYAGNYHDARQLIGQARQRARAARALAAEVWFEIVLGEIDRDTGRGRAAIERFTAATELAGQAGQHAALVWAWVGVAQGHLIVGDADAAAVALAEADRAGDSPIATSWSTRERTRAWLIACRGDLAAARSVISTTADAVRSESIWAFEATLRHDMVRLGEPGASVDRLAELATIVEGPLVQAMAGRARAAVDGDTNLYERVIDQFEAIDSLVLAAESAVEAAEQHRRLGNQRAAGRLTQRSTELLDLVGGARTPALLRGHGVEPLTAREREVAVLAAAGVSSKEIGERLDLATRTVDTHLGRVYRKLGISGRDELRDALGNPPS
jgi:ATP/maltotriose-dependent transcriptional regulator MalT